MTNLDNQLSYFDIILIYPKTGQDVGSNVAPPHALLTIAAPLVKKGYRVKIVDQRRDPHWRRTVSAHLAKRPICVGISSMTGTQIHFALEAARFIRQIDDGRTPIVWGGAHPTILPEQTLKNEYVDIVYIGESDITFMELVEALRTKAPLAGVKGIAFKDGAKIVMTQKRELINVEDLLPIPWDIINVEDYIQPDFYLKKSPRTLDIGQTSRGCPF